MKALAAGVGLTVLVTLVLWRLFGAGAVFPAAVFGVVATAIQIGAVRALRRGWGGAHTEFLKGVAVGMGLRLAGVVLLTLVIALDRGRFPPLPTAFGFLGVLVPLLFLEVRFVR